MKHLDTLKTVIKNYDRLVVAFSGGADSSVLAIVAKEILGENCFVVRAETLFNPSHEKQFAESISRDWNFTIHSLKVDPLNNETISKNPPNRCYHCKLAIFGAIKAFAKEKGVKLVADGTNIDDLSTYRPGLKACGELDIVHPFVEAKLGKRQIRRLGRLLGLPNWRFPAAACLATRVPHGQDISRQLIDKIRASEDYLVNLGLRECRVRVLGNDAVIEVLPAHFRRAVRHANDIVKTIKNTGFQRVFLNLEGYSQSK